MAEIKDINGMGPKKIELLSRLNINCLSDALKFYPRTYEDRTTFVNTRNFLEAQKACIILMISSISTNLVRKGLEITKILAYDDFGACEITLYNQKFLARKLKTDIPYVFYGLIETKFSKVIINSPSIEEFSEKSSKILPIYSLTSGLTQADIRKVTEYAVKNCEIQEFLPDYLIEKYKFLQITQNLEKIHFPKTKQDIEVAKRRIIFEDMFLYFVKLQYLHNKKRKTKGFLLENDDIQEFLQSLEYKLTNAQLNSIKECIQDMKSGIQMSRLLQGDVGCGKTIVATILCYLTAKNKKQSAFMVPTEILANQHFEELQKSFGSFGINVQILTGSTTAKNKKIIKENLKNGQIDVIIGTHAIITDDTEFFDLGMVIVDEQHRFGVIQRAKLTAKGENPHILVMSATPIPRTLSLILYGDLEISIIDEMPKGRKVIETFVVCEDMRKRIYKFIKKHIDNKNQVYIVCPLVEESENLDAKDAVNYHENLKNIFKDYKVGLIHGKMKAKEKDEAMLSFSNGQTDILVSTTVIEVGVNVKNATVMVVENAERFGLFALHQLRGRVGRGDTQSYCILFSGTQSKRLDILAQTNDGFEIAKVDLETRGGGDFFGSRQSGASAFELLNSEVNMKVLKYANLEAKSLLDDDLSKYPNLKEIIRRDLVDNKLNIFN